VIVTFVNRVEELRALERILKDEKPALVLLYGRRRIGKTRLVQEFLRGKRGLYFYVPNAEERTILNELSRVVEDEFFEGFRFLDFSSFMEYLAGKCREEVVVAIDEFQRLTNIPGAISIAQRYWDEKLSKARCCLVLSGSSMGAIRGVALSGNAPLYGRRTAAFKIEPLRYLHLYEWFRRYSDEELVKIYGAFGGTPAYLERVDESLRPEENIVQKILDKRSPLHDEPEMLLMEELRVPQRYMDILTAIAAGKTALSEIADAAGLSRENVTTYLKTLEVLDLIDRITPATEPEAKRGLYKVRDPFFNFWFRFVRPNRRELEFGLEREVWQGIRREFDQYLGWVFEEVSHQTLVEMAKRKLLPMAVQRVGRWWWKETEIDVLALGVGDGDGLVFEVKWSDLDYREAMAILSGLSRRAAQVPGIRQPVLGIIAKRIVEKERIRAEGFMALDLPDIRALAQNQGK